MKIYRNYQEIKDKHKKNAYDVFTNYVMEVITLDQRKKIRDDWSSYGSRMEWQDYLIRDVNVIKNFNKKNPFISVDYSAIESEIKNNFIDLKTGHLDVYEFTGYISEKYIEPVDKKWGDRLDDNPFLDVLFGILEINGIELY